MEDRIDLLWRFYDEENALMMHEEEQRSTATNILVAIAGAILAILGWNKSTASLGTSDLPLTIFLMLIGILGVIFALEFYYSRDWHDNLKLMYLGLIANPQCKTYAEVKTVWDKSDPINTAAAEVWNARLKANDVTKTKHPYLKWIPKWLLWAFLSAIVAFIGLILTLIILY